MLGAGCSGPQVSLELAQNDEFFIPDALETAGRRFFGARRGVAAEGGLLSGIGRDTLSSGSSTAYARTRSRSIGIGAGVQKPLARNLSLVGRTQLSHGHSRYHLPEGAGVLIDPITVRFSGVALDASGGLAVHSDLARAWGLRAELGGGVSAARVRTRIASALLDVTSRSTTRAGYVYLGLGAHLRPEAPGAPVIRLEGRVRYYPAEGVSPQAGIRLEF